MPRVPKAQVAPHQLHGVEKINTNLTMRERIKKRFRPTDTVKVKNITSEPIEWQWMDEQDENYTIEDDTNIKLVERDDPGLWRLEAGETDVLIGSCAYLMIEALYKMVCVMKIGIVLHPLDEREIRNFSFDDPERQEQFIDAVFQGKVTPNMMYNAAVSQLDNAREGVEEQLPKLATERSEWERRQQSETSRVTPAHATSEPSNITDLANEFEAGESLLGTATGGLPADRQEPVEQPEDKPTTKSKEKLPEVKTPEQVPAKSKAKEPVTA